MSGQQLQAAPTGSSLYTVYRNHSIDVDVATAWTPVITSFGQCFQFKTDKTVYSPSSSGGLHFAGNLQQEEYDSLSDIAGVRSFTAQPGTPINDQVPSVFVIPGVEAYVGIDSFEFVRSREIGTLGTLHWRSPLFLAIQLSFRVWLS
jgi:hypothetical protein